MLPFAQKKIGENRVVRTFSEDVPDEELKWHRDAEDRVVRVIGETDWGIQFDNRLPQRLTGEVLIPAGVYHRVIKGTGELKVEIRMERR